MLAEDGAIADAEVSAVRLPPHSIEAEQAVLGGLLIDNEAWERICDVVHEHDFYRASHRKIWVSIQRLLEQSKPADVLTVAEDLGQHQLLQEVGGNTYLGELTQRTPSAANIRRYAELVHERAVLRQLVHVGGEIADTAYFPHGKSAAELVDLAEKKVFDIAERGARQQQGFRQLGNILTEVVEHIDVLYNDPDRTTGIPTGFTDLDEKLSGLQAGDLIIVAGRPSMGKTAFSLNIAEHVAIRNKLPVAVFSMEMGGSQLVMRMLGSVGKIDQHKLRTGRLSDDDWGRITYAVGLLSEAPLHIDETAGLNPLELRARARRLHRQYGKLGLIVIDYLQLMSSLGGNNENRATEISEISRSLKALAKELNVPVIALSQLNRTLEQRPSKRPVMSDLRESGAIEQDADVILFIYRDEVYHPDNQENKGLAEIIIGKQRNGPIGTVKVTFLGQHTRFENHASSYYDSEDAY